MVEPQDQCHKVLSTSPTMAPALWATTAPRGASVQSPALLAVFARPKVHYVLYETVKVSDLYVKTKYQFKVWIMHVRGSS